MRTFLDAGAVLTVLITVYGLSGLFVSLPDLTPYTYNSFPGSLLVLPIFFLIFYVLHKTWKHRRWYWLVGCFFCWPLSALYYFLFGRKEFGENDAQLCVGAGRE